MKKEHSQDRSRSSQPLRTFIAMALNLLLILGPIVSVSSMAKAEVPEPQQASEIDAAFFHTGEKASYFFQGDHYYRLTETKVDAGYPKKLPGDFKGLHASFHGGIDAAVIDPSSGTLYFFKGNKYAAINADTKTVYPGYSDVTLPGGWRGLPAEFTSGLDAAIDEEGAVVLIKGNRRAIVKSESLVRVEDFSASALTGAGMVNAAFKYSNGRNYFFSGTMFSRAIGFNKEPTQLNPIASTWIGIRSATLSTPTDPNVVRGDISFSCNTGQVNPPGDRSKCVTKVFFHPAAGISFDEAQETAIRNGWVLANKDEMEVATSRLDLSSGGQRGMINDGRLALPTQSPGPGLTRGPNIGTEGSHQGFFYVLKQVAGREQAAPPPPEWSDEILTNPLYDLRRFELLCNAGPSNPMLDGWRYGDPMIEEAGRMLLTEEGKTPDRQALNLLASELGRDPVRRWQFAPFMLRVMWDAVTNKDPIPIQAQFTRKFEQWAACDETKVARFVLADWNRHIGKYGVSSLPTGQQPFCEQVPLEGGGTAERCIPAPTVYEVPPKRKYELNTLGLLLDTTTGRGSTKGFLPRENPMQLGQKGKDAVYLLYKPMMEFAFPEFNATEDFGSLGKGMAETAAAAGITSTAGGLGMLTTGVGAVVGRHAVQTVKFTQSANQAIKAKDIGQLRLEQRIVELKQLGMSPGDAMTRALTEVSDEVVEEGFEAIGKQATKKVAKQLWGRTLSESLEQAAQKAGQEVGELAAKKVAATVAKHVAGKVVGALAVIGAIATFAEIFGTTIADAAETDKFDAALNKTARTVKRYRVKDFLGPNPDDFQKTAVFNELVKMVIASPADQGLLTLDLPKLQCEPGMSNAGPRTCVREVKFYERPSLSIAEASAIAKTNGWQIATPDEVAEAWYRLGLDVYAYGMTSDGSFAVPVQRDHSNFKIGPNTGVTGGNQGFFYTTGKVPPTSPGISWNRLSGTMKHVSVGNDGMAWALDSSDRIFKWNGRGWTIVPGGLKQISVGSTSHVWGVNGSDEIYRWNGTGWDLILGRLKHVSVGSDGTVWGVNSADQIWRWNGSGWVGPIPGRLKQISVGSASHVWGINASNEIFRWNGSDWTKIPGTLKYVSAGADGSVWGIDPNNSIFVWDGNVWKNVAGGLSQISSGGSGNVWGVNSSGQIYSRSFKGGDQAAAQPPVASTSPAATSSAGTSWKLHSGGALKHVSVGSDGTTWALDTSDRIYRWNGSGWSNVPGGLKQISVGSANQVWGVNGFDQIFRWNGQGWEQIAGGLKHVSVGSDGSVWGVNSSDEIWRWNGSGWEGNIPGKLDQISVGSASHVWGVNASNEIFRWNGSGWTRMPGSLKYVSVGSDGTVWGVNPNNQIFIRQGDSWVQVPGGLNQISVGSSSHVWGVDKNGQIFSRTF